MAGKGYYKYICPSKLSSLVVVLRLIDYFDRQCQELKSSSEASLFISHRSYRVTAVAIMPLKSFFQPFFFLML